MSSLTDRRRVRVALLSLGALLATTIGALVAPAPIASAYTTQSAAFSGISCSGDNLASAWGSVIVPANAVTATFQITGGGGAGGDNWDANGGTGGGGGIVTGTIDVVPGQTVWARVGCGAPDGGGNPAGYTSGGSGGPYGGGGGGSTAVCVNNDGAAGCSGGTVYGIAGGGGGGGRAFDGTGLCSNHTGGSGGTANTGGTTSVGQLGGTGFGGARGSNGGGGTNGGGGGGGIGQGPGQNTGANTPNNTGGTGGTADGPDGGSGGGASSVAPTGSGGNGANGVGSDNVISGGGGGGYTGGGAGGGGDDGSSCDNESGSGGGAGSSWVSDSAWSVSWGNAAANAGNCTSTGIGTLPGGGGNRGVGGCDGNATISFLINTVPTGSSQNINVTKGVSQTITLAANDAAGEGTPTCVNVSGLSQGKGTRTGSGCSYTYTANANTSGSDSFTYQVRDADDALSTTYTITLNIQNRAPTGAAQSGLNATKGVALSIPLANADLDNDTRTCSVISGPSKGNVTLSGASPSTGCSASYTANANTGGADSFSYRVTDSVGGVSAVDYVISLNIVNATPTSGTSTVSVAPGSTTSIVLPGSDADAGDVLTCSTGAVTGGTLSGGTGCTRTFTAGTTLGSYPFTFTRSDTVSTSPTGTVTVNVVSPDVAISKSHVGVFNDGEQGTYTIDVSNVGNSPTAGTITVVDDLPAGMTYASSDVGSSAFSCAPGLGGTQVTCTRTAALAASASTSFTITVDLEDGAASGTNTASVSASPDHTAGNNSASDPTSVNLRPEAFPVAVTTEVDEPVAIELSGSDPESGALTYNVGSPTSGSLSGTAPSLTFTPAPDSDASAAFTYTVTDPNGHTSFAVTVTITVIRPGIRGQVVSDDSGLGVGDIRVRLYEDGVGFTEHFTDTDSLGDFDLGEVPDGDYRVVFSDPAQDYVTEWWDDSLLRSTSTEITFTDGAVLILDASLATGAEIDVSITNPGTYTVALYNSGPVGVSAFRSVPGVDDGSVALRGLPAGTYYVSVTDPTGALVAKWSGNQTVRADAAPIALGTGATTSEVFTLVAPNTIAGTISDSEGPVPMVTVQAYNASSGAYVKAGKTDALGEYAIRGVPAGQYKLVFRDSSGAHPVTWFGGGDVIGSATPVTMTNGGSLTADAEIPRTATVTGVVTGGPGGLTPLVGARVTLYRGGATVRTYLTDATGTYTATGLTAGSYTVLFAATGHRTEYNEDKPRKADADVVAVVAGDTVEIDATLTPA